MSHVSLRLEGDAKGIAVGAFINAVTNWFKVLAEVDTAISGISTGSLEWFVSNLATGSLIVEAESRSKIEDKNYAPEVIKTTISGLNLLETEGLTPPYLTETGLGHAKKLLKLIGNNGVSGISIANTTDSTHLSAKASANIDQLSRIQNRSIGSVEGKLEKISIHGKQPKFVVYHDRTHKAVTCNFHPDFIEEVKDALGKRVIASGEVSFNAKNEPVRLNLESLRKLRSRNELPTISSIGGSIPDFTGGLETTEYLRSIRNA